MRRYNEALWCVRKHLSLAMVHIQETLQKIYRLRGAVGNSMATREECDYALQNLIAVGEHVMEVISKSSDLELNEFMRRLDDDVRMIRQQIVETGLPFRDVSISVSEDVADVLSSAYKSLTELLLELDRYASRMAQEYLKGGRCGRCEEDFHVNSSGRFSEYTNEDDELCG